MAETLQVWLVTSNRGPSTVDYLNHKLARFTHSKQGVQIEWRLMSWSTAWIELLRAFKQGSPPDVFEFGTTWIGMLAHLGALSPVPSGVVDKPPLAPYLVDVSRHKGQQYSVPWLVDTTCLLARRDVLNRYHIDPKTPLKWSEFQSICERVRDEHRLAGPHSATRFPKSISFSCRLDRATLHRVFPWLWSGGFEFPSLTNGPVRVLTAPEIRPGLAFVQSLMRLGDMTIDEARLSPPQQSESFFIEGRHAFLTSGWFSVFRRIAEEDDLFEATVATDVMAFPEGPSGSLVFGGGSCLGVSPLSSHPELAWELVHAMVQPDLLNSISLWVGAPPAYACQFWDAHAHIPAIQILRSTMQNARTYPNHPAWASIERTLVAGMNELQWYLLTHDFDDYALETAERLDQELNAWLQLAWEVERDGVHQ